MTAPQPEALDVRLVGERVLLRTLRPEDAADAFPLIHGREAITRWLVWNGPRDEEDLREGYADWKVGDRSRGLNYKLAVEAEGVGLVGTLSLRFEGHPFMGDVGYWIAEEHWGQGFGTEAVRLTAALAFDHLGARALTAVVFLGNHASARLLEKAGFVRETDAGGRPLVGRPTELDRDAWTFGATPADLRRLGDDWSPREARVPLR